MLKNRSTSATKQALMADYSSLPSPTNSSRNPNSSIFTSQKLFPNLASKGFTDTTDYALSPTSILDTKPFSPVLKTQNPPIYENPGSGSKKVGLGLVDDLADEMPDQKSSKPKSGKVVFGSKLKIQIPTLPPSGLCPAQSPRSPGDFGIKTRNSQLGLFSPSLGKKSPFGCQASEIEKTSSPRILAAPPSPGEMELLEEYTCVISRGPNPKTTHIFDDCVVESCCGVGDFAKADTNGVFGNRSMSYPSEGFLSFCFTCKKNLGHGEDIYMYRGEKGFCSSECRQKEMMLEEKMGKKVV